MSVSKEPPFKIHTHKKKLVSEKEADVIPP